MHINRTWCDAMFRPVLLGIGCEPDIILFSIHDELKETSDRARYRE
jgi:hypothetical protein